MKVKLFCKHSWSYVGKPKPIYTDYGGIRVFIVTCQCRKCGKKKKRKVY